MTIRRTCRSDVKIRYNRYRPFRRQIEEVTADAESSGHSTSYHRWADSSSFSVWSPEDARVGWGRRSARLRLLNSNFGKIISRLLGKFCAEHTDDYVDVFAISCWWHYVQHAALHLTVGWTANVASSSGPATSAGARSEFSWLSTSDTLWQRPEPTSSLARIRRAHSRSHTSDTEALGRWNSPGKFLETLTQFSLGRQRTSAS